MRLEGWRCDGLRVDASRRPSECEMGEPRGDALDDVGFEGHRFLPPPHLLQLPSPNTHTHSANMLAARNITLLAPRGARLASNLPIPPKVATPAMVSSGGSSARMEGVVGFYKALPKGQVQAKSGGGIKARFFDGKNASPKPIVAWIGAMLLLGYTIDVSAQTAFEAPKGKEQRNRQGLRVQRGGDRARAQK